MINYLFLSYDVGKEGESLIKDIILATIAVLGPIISGIWSYKSAVKKAESELEAVKEKNKADIEAIRIQSENEIERIREKALAESQLHENKTKTNLMARQFDNPEIQKMIGNALGSVMEKTLEQKVKKNFDEQK